MRRQGFLSAVVLAATMVITASGAALGATPDPGRAVNVSNVSALKAAATGRYWTRARMQAARPMPKATTKRSSSVAATNPKVGKHPGRVESSVPRVGGGGSYNGDPVDANYHYPYPFTRRTVEKQLQKVFPYRTVGVVFMRQDGVDFVCSGSSVQSAPRQVVFTAGHCMHDGAGHASRHVLFVPAYRNGSVPYGTFAATHTWVMNAWRNGGDDAFDEGAFSVGRNSRHQTLQSQVGALGFAWDQSRLQHWDVMGYPAEYPFSGEKTVICEASHAIDDLPVLENNDPGSGYDTIGIGCDMTGGSSGGPWILGLGRGNYLNGVVSYGYPGEPRSIYGPYFGVESNWLRCRAATGDPTATSC
jgi:V8-like Glu-specific endopeptidase